MNLDRLQLPEGPWIHRLTASESELCDLAWSIEHPTPPRTVARVVRGLKSRTAQGLFDETAAAFQFPFYFGENWDALEDCLADLGWLSAQVVLIIVSNAVHLLDAAPPDELHTFLDVVQRVALQWREDPPGRSQPRVVHAILHCTPDDERGLTERLATAETPWDAFGAGSLG